MWRITQLEIRFEIYRCFGYCRSSSFHNGDGCRTTAEKLPSGVIVEHLKRGTGAQPAATDVVKVNYRDTLPNGTEFDSSAKHGGPASIPAQSRDSVLDSKAFRR